MSEILVNSQAGAPTVKAACAGAAAAKEESISISSKAGTISNSSSISSINSRISSKVGSSRIIRDGSKVRLSKMA